MKDTQSMSKPSIIICSILGGTFFVLSTILSCICCDNYYKYRSSNWRYNQTFDVWVSDMGYRWDWYRSKTDNSLGAPILDENVLRLEAYWRHNDILYGSNGTTLPQYYHLSVYEITDSTNYLANQLKRLNEEGYHVQMELQVDGTSVTKEKLIYWDTYEMYNYETYKYEYGGLNFSSRTWHRKHIIKVSKNKAYELVAYVPQIDLYDDHLEDEIYSIEDPKVKLNIGLWATILWISISITALLGILLLVLLCNKIKCSITKNKRAVILFKYQMIGTIIEFVIFNILLIFDAFYLDIEEHILVNCIYTITFLLRIILIIQAYKKTRTTDDTYYLVPQKLKQFISRYSISEAPLRALLVFIIFPLYYLLTLPGGFFFLLYIIPAVIVYTLVFFIQWIIKGTKETL